MKEKALTPGFLMVTGLIVIAAVFRLLPHPPNFTPVAAMALFGGAYFSDKRMAFVIPVAAMLFADLFLGFHSTMIWVYGAFIVTVLIGMWIGQKTSFGRVAAGALGSSILFFAVTNFGVWLTGMWYPVTPAGLAACYTAAIPFFHYNVIGDLVFTGALFGAYEFAKAKLPQLQSTNA